MKIDGIRYFKQQSYLHVIAPDGFNEPLNMFLQHVRLHVRMEVLWTVHHAHVPVIHTGVEIIVQVNVHIN